MRKVHQGRASEVLTLDGGFPAGDIPIMKVPFTFQDGDKVGGGDLDAPESSRPDLKLLRICFPEVGKRLGQRFSAISDE